MPKAELRDVRLDELEPHPANPRLMLREDVVTDIERQVRLVGFRPEYALLVAPVDGRLRIISGHHRSEAARRAGLGVVPAWVREMDEDEQFFELVTANSQGELDPLERGMHALTWSGHQKTYAERLGVSAAQVSYDRSAARVIHLSQLNPAGLLGRSTHLYEISRADERLWPMLVGRMLAGDWSAADTRHHVGRLAEFSIPDGHQCWLPSDEVAEHCLSTGEFSPRTAARLVVLADQTYEWIAANGTADQREEFASWLIANKGGRSWQPRAITEYLARLIAEQFIVKGWHQGDWRDHVDRLDDSSVTLLLTDPPYGQGYQSDYRLDRRVERKHQMIAADDASATDELLAALEALDIKLAADAHVLVFCGWASEPEMRDVLAKAGLTLRGSLVWDKQATGMGDPETTFAPAHERILHAVKGSPPLYRRAPDLLRSPRCDSTRHPTEKPTDLLAQLIEATTTEGQLVADPFGGVGSTLAAAKAAGRRWWGCELDESYHRLGEERLS